MKYILKDSFRTIYQCNLLDLPKLFFSDMNRQVDEQRVQEIVKSIPSDAKVLPSPLIEAFERNGKIFLLDGQHRISALNIVQKYRRNITFFISVLVSSGDPKQEFIRINKNVQVSELYLEQEDHRKQLYEDIVRHYYSKYKPFFKTSNSPHKPHMNKDRFLQILYESDTKMTFDEIISAYTDLSEKYRSLKESDDPKMKKCKDFNFYLFFAEPFELKKAIKMEIKKQLFSE